MKVQIELTRSSDAEDLARWLTTQGIEAEVLSDSSRDRDGRRPGRRGACRRGLDC